MKRSAFTLVELLVVIAVVAMLAALLLVAINGARETARRNQCLTRQRDLALAILTYNSDNNGLPGVINQLGARTTPPHYLSWVVTILPMIGENKRYEYLTKDVPDPAEVNQALVPLFPVLCPSVNPQENGRLNYFVNCGPDNYANSNIDFVLFRDRRISLASTNTKVKVEDIPDGASNTVLLLEDTDRGVWHEPEYWASTDPISADPNIWDYSQTRNRHIVRNLGFTWWIPESSLPVSKHVGTGNMAFADGSAKPINNDVALIELIRLFCPDDVKAKSELGFTNL